MSYDILSDGDAFCCLQNDYNKLQIDCGSLGAFERDLDELEPYMVWVYVGTHSLSHSHSHSLHTFLSLSLSLNFLFFCSSVFLFSPSLSFSLGFLCTSFSFPTLQARSIVVLLISNNLSLFTLHISTHLLRIRRCIHLSRPLWWVYVRTHYRTAVA
jgi:hypothetical protein